jgi:hypothetical protein
MTYQYQPGTKEVNELCEKLKAELPSIDFKFLIDKGGLMRIRGQNHDLNNWRDYECLLREQTPTQVVEAFVGALRTKQPTESAR